VISRYFVIFLAFLAAGLRAAQGGIVEAIGLAGLGGGLVVLKLAARRPALKPIAWIGFLAAAVSIGIVLIRRSY
jgi:hypothetical protein